MAKIGIIGAGVGGLTAAIKLQRSGHTVTVFEQKKENELAHPWMDDIRFNIFSACGIEAPEEGSYYDKGKRLFISPDCKSSFHVPFSPPMVEISIHRHILAAHLVSLAKSSGVIFRFETPVNDLLIENNCIKGLKTSSETLLFNLIIDSSGIHSPFRAKVPPQFGIKSNVENKDILFTWRGFYKFKAGENPPETDRNIHIKHLGEMGLSWCNVNQKGEVDVFIGRIEGLTENQLQRAINDLRQKHSFLSRDVIQEGKRAQIPLRSPLEVMVADGYAAIGDAAFMTMPMMGSGIEASMKAATILTNVINKYNLKFFTARNIWEYQVNYYKEIGSQYSFINEIKTWLLSMNAERLNWLFSCGAVTDEDMALISTEKDSNFTVFDIVKKARIMLKRPEIVGEALKHISKALLAKAHSNAIPKKYNIETVLKWSNQ